MTDRAGALPRIATVALALAGIGAFGFAGCTEKKEPAFDENVVAMVNGEILSRADFEKALVRDLQGVDPLEPRSPEQVEPYRRALLDTLIERTLLLQQARKLNLQISPEEIDRGVLRISADYPADGFDEALAQGRMSRGELKRDTAALLMIEKLFDEHVYQRVAVTEEEIRQHFETHGEEFHQQEQVRAAQIVVRSLDEARRVQQLLRQGKKFADLARKYSLSADARVGGDLGFFPRGVMPPSFDEAAFKLAVGQVSDVVASEYGFHLFKVLQRKPAAKPELAEVRPQVEARLLKEKRVEAQRAYVAKLRSEAQLTVNEPVLQSITGRPQGDEAR
ncbi:MAG: peptidyl-prolyl cis-trans isomerase [Myxococcaceae bacterium]